MSEHSMTTTLDRRDFIKILTTLANAARVNPFAGLPVVVRDAQIAKLAELSELYAACYLMLDGFRERMERCKRNEIKWIFDPKEFDESEGWRNDAWGQIAVDCELDWLKLPPEQRELVKEAVIQKQMKYFQPNPIQKIISKALKSSPDTDAVSVAYQVQKNERMRKEIAEIEELFAGIPEHTARPYRLARWKKLYADAMPPPPEPKADQEQPSESHSSDAHPKNKRSHGANLSADWLAHIEAATPPYPIRDWQEVLEEKRRALKENGDGRAT